MSGGIAGLDVLNRVVELLDKNTPNTVKVKTIWKEKSVGLGNNNFDAIFVGLDGESIDIFSLMYRDVDGKSTYDWIHDVSFYVDVRTGKSEEHVLELVNSVMKTLKSNVIPAFGGKSFIKMIPVGATSLNEEFINIFRYMIDVEVTVFNP